MLSLRQRSHKSKLINFSEKDVANLKAQKRRKYSKKNAKMSRRYRSQLEELSIAMVEQIKQDNQSTTRY